MSKKKMNPPRRVPDRDTKYMGLAWIHASFSKDPSTQVGAQIVDQYNYPLGSGYNGPPATICDTDFSWERPSSDNPNGFSKYDVILHAEHNAIKHSNGHDLSNSTLYVTAYPCKKCMLEIAESNISRVVYWDYRSDGKSTLQNTSDRESSTEIARLARIRLEKFSGRVSWIMDWCEQMKNMGVFEIPEGQGRAF